MNIINRLNLVLSGMRERVYTTSVDLKRTFKKTRILRLNRNSERIPRRLRRGKRANIQIRLKVLTVEDSLQLAAGFFKKL
jgi:hypothetical protein